MGFFLHLLAANAEVRMPRHHIQRDRRGADAPVDPEKDVASMVLFGHTRRQVLSEKQYSLPNMPGLPVRRTARADSNRAAAALPNLRGRMSFVKEGYGFIRIDKPERASIYVQRSTIFNQRPKDPRNLGLQKESHLQFKATYQAVRVKREEIEAYAAQQNYPSVPASGPKSVEKEIVIQVDTLYSVNENKGTLKFDSEDEQHAVFDTRCVPNTLLKPTKKVPEIFAVGNKVGFSSRRTDTGAGAAQWQAMLVTAFLYENSSQDFVFDAVLTRCVRHDRKSEFGNKPIYAPFRSDPRAPFQSSQRGPASDASAARPRCHLHPEFRTIVPAASSLPVLVATDKRKLIFVSHAIVASITPIATQSSSGNGASAVRPRCQLLPESRTLSAASYLPFSARNDMRNTSLVSDTNGATSTCELITTQSGGGCSASAVQLCCQLSTMSRTLSVATCLPVSTRGEVRNSSRGLHTNAAATRSSVALATQSRSGSCASAFRPRSQMSTELQTLSPVSSLSDPAKTQGSNSSLFFDANVAPRTSTPVATQSSSVATERADEIDRLAFVALRCKLQWALGIGGSSTKADTTAPGGGHHVLASTEQPPTHFEKTFRQGFFHTTNYHGIDSPSTAVWQQAQRSGERPPPSSGDYMRTATAVPIERLTLHYCGAGEDEQELAKGATRMVMSCLRSVIREEAQALRLEFVRQMGVTAGAGDMSTSGHHGSSSKAPKAKKDMAAGC